jgi:hypothetical protein
VDREGRRSRQGYSTPADARAFLQLARERRSSDRAGAANPLAAAYFRAVSGSRSEDDAAADLTSSQLPPPGTVSGVTEALDAVATVLGIGGETARQPRALLEGTHSESTRLLLLRRLLAYISESEDPAYYARTRELAFLANTLVAGCSVQSRSFTPQEASDAAAAVCNLGLEHWRNATSGPDDETLLPDTFLLDHDLVSIFELGWTVLHEQVSLFVAGELISTLSDLQCTDAHVEEELEALRIELTKQYRAGTPWRARTALGAIAMLDMPTWATVLGLVDECPVIPAAMTAVLEKRTGGIRAAEFEFISSTTQLRRVQEFMRRLPEFLAGS